MDEQVGSKYEIKWIIRNETEGGCGDEAYRS
jgi:hypothetical protein